ncbi:hypothetical protein T484DRAFT_1850842 [Baffinella frigidus]|nr:hypothetical protein T484DRAFT_1850842 [Cryptophyta sp. CCMP2293]
MTSPKVARAALLALTLCIGSTAWSADLAFAPNTFRLPHGLVSRASPRSVCSSSGERRPALLGAFPSPGAALLRNPLLAPGVCGLRAPVALRAKASTIEAEEAVVDSLVLLKGAPVVVQSVDENDPEKVEVLQLNSRTKKAKAKDLRMMFPGPVRSWELQELSGDLPVASMPLPEALERAAAVEPTRHI